MSPMARPMLLIGAIFAVSPGQAQTYDTHSPVCMQVYSIDGSAIGCGYTTIAECKVSAAGRAAQCFKNPYFVAAPAKPPGSRHRRRHEP